MTWGGTGWRGWSTTSTKGSSCTFWAWGLWGFRRRPLSLRTRRLVHLWGLAANRYSTQGFTGYKVINNEKYSWQVYLFDQLIGILCWGPDGGVRAGTLDTGSLILIPLEDLPVALLAFFRAVGLAVTLHFPTWVFLVLALAPTKGSLADSLPGGRVEIGMARIRTSLSKPGMG
jgi:hypothetical protein